MRVIFVYGLPIMAPIFIGLAPAAVQITFCTGAVLSLISTTLLRQPIVRNFLGIPPRVAPVAPTGPESPYKGTINVAGRVTSSSSVQSEQTKPGVADRLKPSGIKAGVGELWKTATDFVGDVMPQAKKTAGTRREKAAKDKAEQYETKRSREIEKERWKWEDAEKRRRARK